MRVQFFFKSKHQDLLFNVQSRKFYIYFTVHPSLHDIYLCNKLQKNESHFHTQKYNNSACEQLAVSARIHTHSPEQSQSTRQILNGKVDNK